MPYNIDLREADRQLTQFFLDHGLREPFGGFMFDGNLHRCPVEGKPDSDTTGSYIGWPYGKSGDGRPHGWCLDWRDGTQHDWQYKGEYVPPAREEREAYMAKIKKSERDKAKRSAEALKKACARFEAAGAANADHRYLALKGISAYLGDIRQDGNLLLIPYTRLLNKGVMGTVQFIYPYGGKRFSAGIAIPPDAAFVIGGDKSSDRIFVAEGMATAQSAAAALAAGGGYRAVIAAGDCGRLKGVLEAVREKYPRCTTFILADDDYKTFLKSDGKRVNPGLAKANSLLRGGMADGILIPSFPRRPESPDDKANEPSDWNDYVMMFGAEAASVELEKQIKFMNSASVGAAKTGPSVIAAEAAAPAVRRAVVRELVKEAGTESGLPVIIEDSKQSREAAGDVIKAMRTANEKAVSLGGSPKYYVDAAAGKIVTVSKHALGVSRRELTTSNGLLAVSDCADFLKVRGSRGCFELRPCKPSSELIASVVNAGTEKLSRLPKLNGISTVPVIRPDFSVHDKAGYDSVTNVYYDKRLEVSIPESPTREDARRCVDDLKDLFADFPFSDQCCFDNTVALLLSCVLRDADIGRIPMAVIDAPRQATGKTLLAQTISAVITGSETATMSLVKDNDESRKRITSILRDGDPIIMFDNIPDDMIVSTPALSRLLTSDVYSDRLLGTNDTLRIRNRAVIISTGNNMRLGGDIPRRSFRIRLDDGRISLKDRRTFVHPEREGNLIRYVKEHNAEILSSVYTLIRAWKSAGMPKWTGKPIESFEKWSCVIGGILEYCGLTEFLKNFNDDCGNMSDEEDAQWSAFVEEISNGTKANETFTSRSIAARCFFDGALADAAPYSLGSTDDKNFAKILGEALYRHRGRLYRISDGRTLKICEAGRDRKNVTQWQIKCIPMRE